MIKIDFGKQTDFLFIKENTHLTETNIQYKFDNQQIIVAKNSEELIGFIVLDYLWSHIPFIAFINVLDDHQREGIGKALLEYLEEYLKRNGHPVLFSSSMKNATEAQGWHRKMGFIDTGIIHDINENHVGELFFRKELDG